MNEKNRFRLSKKTKMNSFIKKNALKIIPVHSIT